MLDAIEHLAQWVRAPLLLVCLARDELLERRPAGAAGAATPPSSSSSRSAPTTRASWWPRCSARRRDDGGELVAAGGRALRRQPAVRRGDGAAPGGGGDATGSPSCPTPCRRCSPRASTRSTRSSAGSCSRRRWSAARSGRARWRRWPSEEGRDLGQALSALQEKDILAAGGGVAPGRRARAGLQARADPRRGLRDAPQGGPLPQALRGRPLHRGARRRPHRRGGGAAGRALRPRRRAGRRGAAWSRRSWRRSTERAVRFLEEAGDAAALLYSNREAISHYRHALELLGDDDDAAAARIGEKQGDVALRLGRVDAAIEVWGECLDHHRGQEDLERVADLHRKLGAGAGAQGRAQGGDRALPARDQPAQGRPAAARAGAPLRGGRLALPADGRQHARDLRVREGAAPGRAAGRDARGQPRARHLRPRVRPHRRHREGALEPRALGRARARGSRPRRDDPRPARPGPPPRDLRGRRPRRGRGLRGGARARRAGRRPAGQVELHSALAQLAAYRADWDQVRRSTDASAELAEREGLVGKLCLPYALRGLLRWRDGDLDGAEERFRRAHELAEQVGWSELVVPGALRAGADAARPRRRTPTP